MNAKFLIAHPDSPTLRAIQHALRDQQQEARVAKDGLDAIDQALDEQPDAIILGTGLPGLKGLDVARALRALKPTQRVPILFITRDPDEAAAVARASLPLVDWIAAPIDPKQFQEHCARLVGNGTPVPVGRGTDPDRELAAISDPLTGLYERHYMLHRLSYEAARAARYKSNLSSVVLRVDDFESLVEKHGRVSADRVLIELANTLRRHARVTDVIGRIAVDQFLVIAPETGQAGAMHFAERMQKQVRVHHFGAALNGTIRVSIGVAASLDASLAESLALLGRAEAALDRAWTDSEEGIATG